MDDPIKKGANNLNRQQRRGAGRTGALERLVLIFACCCWDASKTTKWCHCMPGKMIHNAEQMWQHWVQMPPRAWKGRELVGRQNSTAERTSPQVSFPGTSPLLWLSTLTVHTFDCYLALNATFFKEVSLTTAPVKLSFSISLVLCAFFCVFIFVFFHNTSHSVFLSVHLMTCLFTLVLVPAALRKYHRQGGL